jgi:hypothetical protein
MIDWALAYAAAGFRVVPQRGKRPILREWPDRATSDEATIREWWSKRPEADVGLLTGERFDAFDIEGEHIDRVLALGALPVTPLVETPSGGRHVYVAPLGLGNRRLVLDGVHVGELKGARGAVTAPPTRTTAGEYRWLVAPAGLAVAEAPPWLRGLVEEPAPLPPPSFRGRMPNPDVGARRLEALARAVAAAGRGQRNSVAYWALRRALEEGAPPDIAAEVIERAAVAAGLPVAEVRSIAKSALRAAGVFR